MPKSDAAAATCDVCGALTHNGECHPFFLFEQAVSATTYPLALCRKLTPHDPHNYYSEATDRFFRCPGVCECGLVNGIGDHRC